MQCRLWHAGFSYFTNCCIPLQQAAHAMWENRCSQSLLFSCIYGNCGRASGIEWLTKTCTEDAYVMEWHNCSATQYRLWCVHQSDDKSIHAQSIVPVLVRTWLRGNYQLISTAIRCAPSIARSLGMICTTVALTNSIVMENQLEADPLRLSCLPLTVSKSISTAFIRNVNAVRKREGCTPHLRHICRNGRGSNESAH